MKENKIINLEELIEKLYVIVNKDLDTPGYLSPLTIEALKVLIDYERTKQNQFASNSSNTSIRKVDKTQ